MNPARAEAQRVSRQTVIFSDLDGTLLDPLRYSFDDALPALRLVAARGIPLVLCSSKTCAEILACRREMGNVHPFISENGGGIFIPQGYFPRPAGAEEIEGYWRITLGTPYAQIRAHFLRLRENLGVAARGFADMRVEEVASLTGLAPAQASLAKQRDFDEPFVFEGAPDAGFLRAIEEAGLNWTEGRIFHILGRHDKGRAVRILKDLYQRERGEMDSIGLGDGFNDLPLLQSVEHPVLIRREDGGFAPDIAINGLVKTRLCGPAGWNEAVLELLAQERDL